MENKLFETNDELLDYFIEELDTEDNITLVVDRVMAEEISEYFDEDNFKDLYSICIKNDIDEYYVENIEDKVFCIEHAKYDSKYLEGETDKLIIMREFLCDELLESQNAKEIIIVNNGEDDEPCICCDKCHGCDEEIEIEDEDEINCDECLFDNLSEAHQEYIDEHIDVLLKYGISECEARNLLAEIVQTIYLDGEKDCLLNWSKIFKEIAEEDGEE